MILLFVQLPKDSTLLLQEDKLNQVSKSILLNYVFVYILLENPPKVNDLVKVCSVNRPLMSKMKVGIYLQKVK